MADDVTKAIRKNLTRCGIDFSKLSERETEWMIEEGLKPLRKEIERLRRVTVFCMEALEDIAHPIRKIKADAQAKGREFDGVKASELCHDVNWLREKARKAYSDAAKK